MATKTKISKLRPATAADAEIAMKLYDLRREPEMRKARNFVNFQLWPQSFADVDKIFTGLGTQENAWVRQVTSYWEMAASLVVRGALHPGVFMDWCGEAFFVYAKFKPFLKDMRAKYGPAAYRNVELLANTYPEMSERLKMVEQRIAIVAAAAAAAKK